MSARIDQPKHNQDGDRRVERTRMALREAFNRLILSEGYDALSAAKIAAEANVGRSTFYEHYRGKDDMLTHSLVPLLLPFADTVFQKGDDLRLLAVVEHFWTNRKMARRVMADGAYTVISNTLADLIAERLEERVFSRLSHKAMLPPALTAIQIAQCQLTLIQEWLTGRHGCSAIEIATALKTISHAITNAVVLKTT